MNIVVNKVGDRVELIRCKDEYTHIPPGSQGTVDLIDGIGTTHVTWDNGYHLGLVPGVDEWKTLVHHPDPKTAIVSSKELGTNCWAAGRFVEKGSRCDRIFTCSYPEKKTCRAVQAEIAHLMDEQVRLIKVYENLDNTIKGLNAMLKK